MRIPYYRVSAFTRQPFAGNPAGVCPLERWLPNALLQAVAAENDLSETAFFVPQTQGFDLRWFTPAVEVDLCGHATLASAFVLFTELGYREQRVHFHTRSGWLSAERRGQLVELDFPARPPEVCQPPEKLLRGLKLPPREILKSRDYLAVYDSADQVAALEPDLVLLAEVDSLGVIATAPESLDGLTAALLRTQLARSDAQRTPPADFVSRFFAPRAGVPEDPVTGSAHSTLIPFWARRLGKDELFARQISKRGGELHCRNLGQRVGIGGEAVVYTRGEIALPDPREAEPGV